MTGKQLAEALHSGHLVLGTAMVSRLDQWWPSVLASLGMDMVFLDAEHTPNDRQTLSTLCQLYQAKGVVPVVRIPIPDSYHATMVLDGGAKGVIGPYIETAEQVRQLAGAVKFKPLKGQKLSDFLAKKAHLGAELHDYLKRTNEDNVLIVNIESIPALEQLDEILSVDGLDAVLVGPHDLTCSLGIPEQYDHPRFLEAIEMIIRKARAKQIGVGIHVWEEVGFDKEIEWAKMGANLVIHSNDVSIFTHAMKNHLNRFEAAVGTDRQKARVEGVNI